jgi:WD40 repeat protein
MADTEAGDSPYRGLMPYAEEDAPFFFGREAEREIITANLMASRLTLLYGASGVGKSSVLRAGVAHHLRQQALRNLAQRGTPEFGVVVFSAWRDHPVAMLEERVYESVAGLPPEGAPPVEFPNDPPAYLPEFLDAWARRIDGDLLIILDQFEEFFLYHPQEEGETGLDVQLARAVNRPDLRASFLISIREDALAKLDRFKGRIPNLFDNYLRIEHLDREAARAAIERPIDQHNRLAGAGRPQVRIEPALVEAVLDQVETGRVVLGEAGRGVVKAAAGKAQIETPYLQLVMTRLWEEERRGGSPLLRLATLNRLGGAERIVRTHLDDVVSGLPPTEQEAAARVFHHLVTPSGTKIAHAVPDLADYARLPRAELEPVLEKLSGAGIRILRPVAPPPDQPTALRYEIFHDVLAPAILDWRTRYAQAQEKAEAERRAEEERERAEEAHQRAEDKGRAARRLGWLAAALAVVFVLAMGAGAYGWVQARRAEQSRVAAEQRRQEAEKASGEATAAREAAESERARAERQAEVAATRAREAEAAQAAAVAAERSTEEARKRAEHEARLSRSRELAAAAVANLDANPELGVHLARHAVALTHGDGTVLPEAEDALHRAVQASRARLTLSGPTAPVTGAAWSPDGLRLATASRERVTVWEAASGRELLTLAAHSGIVTALAWSPDRRWLAAGAQDGTTKVWDLGSGRAVLTLVAHDSTVSGVAWNPDGRRLFTAGADSKVKAWHSRSGDLLDEISSTSPITALAASPDGRRLAAGLEDGTVRLWDAASRAEILSLPLRRPALGLLVFSLTPDAAKRLRAPEPRGALVGGVSDGGPAARAGIKADDIILRLDGRDVTDAPALVKIALGLSPQRPVDIELLRQGQRITVRAAPSMVPEQILGLAWSPDSSHLAAAFGSGSAATWNVQSSRRMLTLSGEGWAILSVSWSPDGKRLATAVGDGTARLWDARTGRSPLVLSGHEGPVMRVAWSPDGTRLATSGSDGTARLWEARSGRSIQTLAGAPEALSVAAWSPDGTRLALSGSAGTVTVREAASGRSLYVLRLSATGAAKGVTSLSWSSDGRRLAAASLDGTVKIWDPASGQEVRTLFARSEVTRVAWSPDGQRLAIASGGTATVWDATSGRDQVTLQGHQGKVLAVAWSPDGQRLATASADRTAKVWDLESGQARLTLSDHGGEVSDVAWSPDGQRLATASTDLGGRIWDSVTGQRLRLLFGHTRMVLSIAWSPDGSRVATASADRTAKVWRAQAGDEVFTLRGGDEVVTLRGHRDAVASVAWSPDGALLATAGRDGKARIWDTGPSREVLLIQRPSFLDGFGWSPDGKRLAAGSADKTAPVWDARSGRLLFSCRGHDSRVSMAAWSPDGRMLATAGGADGTARLWEVTTECVERQVLRNHVGEVSVVTWRPDGKAVVSASRGGSLNLWNPSDGSLLWTAGSIGHINSAAWSPDGRRVAMGAPGKVILWDMATGQQLGEFRGVAEGSRGLAWSPDGKRLAITGGARTASVWDVATGRQLFALAGHTDRVTAIAWSPDGKRLATASLDPTVKLFDASRGEELLTLYGHRLPVYETAFSPDGRYLAAAALDGTLRVYAIRIEDLLALAAQRATEPLVLEDCQRYLRVTPCPREPAAR